MTVIKKAAVNGTLLSHWTQYWNRVSVLVAIQYWSQSSTFFLSSFPSSFTALLAFFYLLCHSFSSSTHRLLYCLAAPSVPLICLLPLHSLPASLYPTWFLCLPLLLHSLMSVCEVIKLITGWEWMATGAILECCKSKAQLAIVNQGSAILI